MWCNLFYCRWKLLLQNELQKKKKKKYGTDRSKTECQLHGFGLCNGFSTIAILDFEYFSYYRFYGHETHGRYYIIYFFSQHNNTPIYDIVFLISITSTTHTTVKNTITTMTFLFCIFRAPHKTVAQCCCCFFFFLNDRNTYCTCTTQYIYSCRVDI